MKEEQPNPLELVSTIDLIDELDRRSDGLILAFSVNRSNQAEVFEFHWRKGTTHALGLLERSRIRLEKEAIENARRIDE